METIKTIEEIKKAIVEEMEDVLREREYDFSENALWTIVNTWYERKGKLIELFSKHPLWNPEKMMIQFDTTLERALNRDALTNFIYWLSNAANWGHFSWSWNNKHIDIYRFITNKITSQFFDNSMKEQIDEINKLNPNYKLRTNMKASKAINKICVEEGWDKLEGYNREFAKLSDALNPIKIKRHTVLSLNPVDYLNMSNGNSWKSCHDIWKDDEGAPGCYSSGTISYMLDKHSFIFYTVDAEYDGNKIELEPKIQRQVFGYNDEVLAQSRLYPQSNDYGAKAVYDDIRAVVQKVISECLDKPNMWLLSHKKAKLIIKHGECATCYPDWLYSDICSVSTLKEREDGIENRSIILGAEPICIYCGYPHQTKENIDCCHLYYETCSECGCDIDNEDDVIWIDGRPYCRDCVTECDYCGCYHLKDDMEYIDGNYVCQDCYHSYIRECSECGYKHDKDDMYELADGDYICECCYNTLPYYECRCCEDIYHVDDMVEINGDYYCPDCAENIETDDEDDEEENEVA